MGCPQSRRRQRSAGLGEVPALLFSCPALEASFCSLPSAPPATRGGQRGWWAGPVDAAPLQRPPQRPCRRLSIPHEPERGRTALCPQRRLGTGRPAGREVTLRKPELGWGSREMGVAGGQSSVKDAQSASWGRPAGVSACSHSR